jgi:polyphosphate kinase
VTNPAGARAEATPPPTRPDPEPPRYLNRELSWLDFNARVLDLAADVDLPLLERVRFCSIFSSNLDEFFMVRVAGLLRQAAAGIGVRSADGRTPQAVLSDIRERVIELSLRQSQIWTIDLRKALEAADICIVPVAELDEDELAELSATFEREVFPVLTPLGVGPGQPFPYISGLSLSLGVLVRNPDGGEERFARVKVPEVLPRFMHVRPGGRMVALEDLIAHFLPWLFPGMEIVEHAAFRVTRDADFEVSDEADDLLEAVELELRRRRFGDVVRVEVADEMTEDMLQRLKDGLGVSAAQMYPIDGTLDLADVKQLADLDRPDLRFEPWAPVTRGRRRLPDDRDIFDEIDRGDITVHLPYDSFATSVEAFVRQGAKDRDVVGLKTTVYRTSEDSALLPALIEAAEEGKQSVCLVELKARFDERRNIAWSRSMERAGVHVVYGFANLKIHAKTTLIVRREGDALRRYVHIGTGNYNASTARLYEDFGLFTSDEAITADIADLFNHLTGFGRPQRFRKILAAPFNLRSSLVEHIRSVARAAGRGERARIRIKVNALSDPAIIDELYKASQAGAAIDIVARAICMLRPGVPGLSENIAVRSVVGRFLEHSRVYHFEAGDQETYLFGSADLMPRNLDHRIEVVVPVEDPRARDELNAALEALLADNAPAWVLDASGNWMRLHPGDGERNRGTHAVLTRRAKLRARRRSGARPTAR